MMGVQEEVKKEKPKPQEKAQLIILIIFQLRRDDIEELDPMESFLQYRKEKKIPAPIFVEAANNR